MAREAHGVSQVSMAQETRRASQVSMAREARGVSQVSMARRDRRAIPVSRVFLYCYKVADGQRDSLFCYCVQLTIR